MIYKKPYAWIASLAAVLLTVAGCILFYEIARVRQSITEEVEGLLDEALHEEYQLRLLSLGIYAEPDPNPDRKIQTYRTRTKEKDTVYVFEEPMNVQTADYLINQHDFADKHPTHSVRAAAKRRCNTRERASENNKFNLTRKQARFRAINSSTKTQI